jgi:hypothetical protein
MMHWVAQGLVLMCGADACLGVLLLGRLAMLVPRIWVWLVGGMRLLTVDSC